MFVSIFSPMESIFAEKLLAGTLLVGTLLTGTLLFFCESWKTPQKLEPANVPHGIPCMFHFFAES